jgi:hypothetical protein
MFAPDAPVSVRMSVAILPEVVALSVPVTASPVEVTVATGVAPIVRATVLLPFRYVTDPFVTSE